MGKSQVMFEEFFLRLHRIEEGLIREQRQKQEED